MDEKHSHGTTCAALAAGSGGNDSCSVGIAPDATLSACRVISTRSDDVLAREARDSSFFYLYMENMHVSSNSFGPVPCRRISHSHRRRLQDCPFKSDDDGSPCSAGSACASVDWSSPSPFTACESEIVLRLRTTSRLASRSSTCSSSASTIARP